MKNLYKLIVLGVVAASLTACKVDDNDDSSATGIVGEWMRVNATYNGVSVWDDSNVCDNDNIFIFKSDNTFEFNNGDIKCDPDDDYILDTGSWSWITEGSKLNVDGEIIDVEKLDSDDFIIVVNDDGDEIKGYFKRQ